MKEHPERQSSLLYPPPIPLKCLTSLCGFIKTFQGPTQYRFLQIYYLTTHYSEWIEIQVLKKYKVIQSSQSIKTLSCLNDRWGREVECLNSLPLSTVLHHGNPRLSPRLLSMIPGSPTSRKRLMVNPENNVTRLEDNCILNHVWTLFSGERFLDYVKTNNMSLSQLPWCVIHIGPPYILTRH
jgi:hypothetical protein